MRTLQQVQTTASHARSLGQADGLLFASFAFSFNFSFNILAWPLQVLGAQPSEQPFASFPLLTVTSTWPLCLVTFPSTSRALPSTGKSSLFCWHTFQLPSNHQPQKRPSSIAIIYLGQHCTVYKQLTAFTPEDNRLKPSRRSCLFFSKFNGGWHHFSSSLLRAPESTQHRFQHFCSPLVLAINSSNS